MNIRSNKILQGLILAVLLVAIFQVGFFAGKSQVVCKACKPEMVDFSLFWDAYGKLHTSFIDPQKIDEQKLLYGAIAGMTNSVQDPYTEFFSPEQAKAFKQDLLGVFDGIGVEIGIKKGQLTVVAPLKGTPGDQAGLKPGDQIIKIDGKNASDMPVDEAVNLIRGKKGTQVTLSIFREGWQQTQDFKITRDTIKVDAMSWEIKNERIAYVKINQFGQSLPSDFRTAASQILNSSADRIILDLRDNPGGYLDVAQDIGGWFLKSGQTITTEDFGSKKDPQYFNAHGNAAFFNHPIVVLINKGSASASEILAGALRDNRGVQLIGEKSFGKGSVQEVIELQDSSSFLKVTTAKWLTPKGHSISEVGLDPDIKVEISEEDVANQKDPQLQKAIEIIQQIQ